MLNQEHEEADKCHLLEGRPQLKEAIHDRCACIGPVEYLAQVVLLFVVLAGLYYKRITEKPQRPLKIWALDVSKQLFSGLAAHLCNMAIATIVAMDLHNTTSPCSWYFVVYLIDSVLGVTLTYLLHRAIIGFLSGNKSSRYTAIASSEDGENGSKTWMEYVIDCGEYGNPPTIQAWTPQMIEWVIVTVLARFICGVVIFLFHETLLVEIAAAIDNLYEGHPHLLLFSVMVMCPVLMNLIQAWIQDNILKWQKIVESGKETERNDHIGAE